MGISGVLQVNTIVLLLDEEDSLYRLEKKVVVTDQDEFGVLLDGKYMSIAAVPIV